MLSEYGILNKLYNNMAPHKIDLATLRLTSKYLINNEIIPLKLHKLANEIEHIKLIYEYKFNKDEKIFYMDLNNEINKEQIKEIIKIQKIYDNAIKNETITRRNVDRIVEKLKNIYMEIDEIRNIILDICRSENDIWFGILMTRKDITDINDYNIETLKQVLYWYIKRNLERKKNMKINENKIIKIEENKKYEYCNIMENKDILNNIILGTINNRDFNVLLDTGSSVNIITMKLCTELGLPITNTNKIILKNFLGTEITIDKITRITIKLNNLVYVQDFYVLETKEDKVIIGCTFYKEILDKEKYLEDFMIKNKNLFDNKGGIIKDSICNIDTNSDKIVHIKGKEVNQALKEKVKDELDKLEKLNIIEKSHSKWINPLRPVVKPNGKVRITIDCRMLNNLVNLSSYSLPKIERIIEYTQGMKYFTVLDLTDAFFHIKLNENDKEKTAFMFENKLYQFTRMVQGFKNSPAIMQETCDRILSEQIGVKCCVYLDDIIIFGKTLEEHDNNLTEIANILISNGATVNKNKIQLRQDKVHILGHYINGTTRSPVVNNNTFNINIKRPENKKELQRLIGILNYYHRYIYNYSITMRPLFEILKKNNIFKWTELQEQAFLKITSQLKEDVCLWLPDYNKKFILTVDASENGVGAILKQEFDGCLRPIQWASRAFSFTEKQKHITYQELAAIVFGIKKFAYYLKGRKFIVQTDHKALIYLKTKVPFGTDAHEKLIREIEEYDFDVEYMKGEDNTDADFLSRINSEEEEQKKILKDDSEIDRIVKVYHEENCAHRSGKTLKDILNKKFIINNLQKYIDDCIANCEECNKNTQKRKYSQFITTLYKNQIAGCDIYQTDMQSNYLTYIEYFTRKIMIVPLNNKSSEEVKIGFKKIFDEMGRPDTLVMDAGKEFDNESIFIYLNNLNINQHIISVDYHQANGRIERVHRDINQYLRKMQSQTKEEEVKNLINFVLAYNDCEHRGIKMPPNAAWLNEQDENLIKRNRGNIYGKEFLNKKQKEFNIGDIVAVKRNDIGNKLRNLHEGKFLITGKEGENSYLVQNMKTGRVSKRSERHLIDLTKILSFKDSENFA